MKTDIDESCVIPPELCGKRVDQAVSTLFPQYSRVLIQKWIKTGELRLDETVIKPKLRVIGGELIVIKASLEEQGEWDAEDIGLDIVYEDESLIVLNKQAGLVVHPAAGNRTGTLLNGLLHHNAAQINLPRAGIVHRLDKNTSGLMVVAKTLIAHTSLVRQLQDKSVGRIYEAICYGELSGGSTIDLPIERHPVQRTKMAVVDGGKHAVTHIRLIKRLKGFTHVQAQLETGRTHQIRVHLSHTGYPLVGDPQYGGRLKFPKAAPAELKDLLQGFERQALHAKTLKLVHPETDEHLEWQQNPPEDFQKLLIGLEQFCAL